MPDARGLGTREQGLNDIIWHSLACPVAPTSVAQFQRLSQGNQDFATPEPSPAEAATRSAGPETGGGGGRDFGTGRRLANPRPICDARLQTQGWCAADWPALATGRRICDVRMQMRARAGRGRRPPNWARWEALFRGGEVSGASTGGPTSKGVRRWRTAGLSPEGKRGLRNPFKCYRCAETSCEPCPPSPPEAGFRG